MQGLQDLISNAVFRSALDPILGNNDTEGTGNLIDRSGFEGLAIVVQTGIEGDTLSGSLMMQPTLYHGDLADGSDLAVCAAADVIQPTGQDAIASGIFATVDANGESPSIFAIGYRGSKRYVKLKIDFTGTHTNGTPVSAVAILTMARYRGKNQF